MTVTQVTAVSQSRCRIYLDEQFAFILYKGELRRLQIREGQELSDESYRYIMSELLPQRAKARSMNLLQARDYTRRQLEDKLKRGEYPQACIDEALADMEAYGYLDDERYAKDYITYHIQDRSRSRIEMDLMKKGIGRETVRKAFEELEEMGVEQEEMELVLNLLKKKKYCADTATKQEQQRMYGFLYRKGFHADIINRALLLDITSISV